MPAKRAYAPPFAALILATALLAGCGGGAKSGGGASAAPAPPAARQIFVTASGDPITMLQFANGLTLIHKRNASNRIVGISVALRAGAANELEEEGGLTNLTLKVMRKGAGERSAREIAEAIEGLGVSLSAEAGHDTCFWSLITTVEDLEPSLDLLAEILLRPTFPPDEIENERKQVLAGIRARDDNSFQFTYKRFLEALYEGHPYARPVEGEPESVNRLTRDQMVALHAESMQPSNMIVSIVGDLTEDQAREAIEKRLGAPCPLPKARLEPRKDFPPQRRDLRLSKKVEQGMICLGYTTVPITSPDYPALRLTSALMGEGMSSRLFTTLRDQQGLAYAVGSAHRVRRQQGHFFCYIGTKPETLGAARDGMFAELDRLRREPVSEEELTRARNYAIGRYLMGHQTNSDQAYFLAWWQAMGMGVNYDEAFPVELERVTARDIMRAANRYFLEPTITTLVPEGFEPAAAPLPEESK